MKYPLKHSIANLYPTPNQCRKMGAARIGCEDNGRPLTPMVYVERVQDGVVMRMEIVRVLDINPYNPELEASAGLKFYPCPDLHELLVMYGLYKSTLSEKQMKLGMITPQELSELLCMLSAIPSKVVEINQRLLTFYNL